MVDVLDSLLITLAVRLHAFSVCEIQQGWQLQVGPSDNIIIHYVLAGRGSVRSGSGRWVAFSPRSVIIVPAGTPHTVGEADNVLGESRAEDHCKLLDEGLIRFTAGDRTPDTLLVCGMISATYAGALGFFASLKEPLVEDLSASTLVQHSFDVMFAEITKPSIGTMAIAEALMKHCLIILLREHLQGTGSNSSLFKPLQDERLARALTEVLENPAAPHSVESLAMKAGMSRASFAGRFATVYNQTPMEFVQKVRLRMAARLLTTTGLPIKVISNSIGYASRTSFSRAFRAIYGVDPKTFRLVEGQEDREPEPIEKGSAPDLALGADETMEPR